jgi:hypothetical protein
LKTDIKTLTTNVAGLKDDEARELALLDDVKKLKAEYLAMKKLLDDSVKKFGKLDVAEIEGALKKQNEL